MAVVGGNRGNWGECSGFVSGATATGWASGRWSGGVVFTLRGSGPGEFVTGSREYCGASALYCPGCWG